MRAFTPAIGLGLLLLALWIGSALYLRSRRKKKEQQLRAEGQHATADAQAAEHALMARLHQRVIGLGIVFYGIYLSTLVGTMTRFVLPGATALGGGAAAGAGVGLLTYLVIGTVGVATGGTGVALGALAMSLIGGGVGAAGAAAGAAGFRALSYPLVSPWFWGPVIGLGIYLIVGKDIPKELTSKSSD
ncbi:hypothetical protein [Alicycliphilus denitrificans]|uniref:hypothetical protein n=1 Tax=Alicycliphilus denitrificans TaxID=179636 RepID=UPI003A7FAEC6